MDIVGLIKASYQDYGTIISETWFNYISWEIKNSVSFEKSMKNGSVLIISFSECSANCIDSFLPLRVFALFVLFLLLLILCIARQMQIVCSLFLESKVVCMSINLRREYCRYVIRISFKPTHSDSAPGVTTF